MQKHVLFEVKRVITRDMGVVNAHRIVDVVYGCECDVVYGYTMNYVVYVNVF
jgi:hypothetical protein